MKIRQAVMDDASQMSGFLQQLTALGKRTSPSDLEFVCTYYIDHPDNIQCTVAEGENGRILGFQILKIASEVNAFGVTPGWGIIGTHVSPDVGCRGVGKALFTVTREAARRAELDKIDASIAATNVEGLAYYDALGFRNYRTPDGMICKYYEMTG